MARVCLNPGHQDGDELKSAGSESRACTRNNDLSDDIMITTTTTTTTTISIVFKNTESVFFNFNTMLGTHLVTYVPLSHFSQIQPTAASNFSHPGGELFF